MEEELPRHRVWWHVWRRRPQGVETATARGIPTRLAMEGGRREGERQGGSDNVACGGVAEATVPSRRHRQRVEGSRRRG